MRVEGRSGRVGHKEDDPRCEWWTTSSGLRRNRTLRDGGRGIRVKFLSSFWLKFRCESSKRSNTNEPG